LRRLLWATAEKLREFLDRDLLVSDLLSDYPTDYRRDLRMSELDRTEKRITLGEMWCRVLEDSDDKTGLILGRDRSVPLFFASLRADFCDMFTMTSTPASLAACAN
jgi:hypothetical protein